MSNQLTEDRKVDRNVLYRPGVEAARPPVTWWPTNAIAERLLPPDAGKREVEEVQFAVFIAVAAWASMLLYQTGWREPAALAVWSLVSTGAFAAAMVSCYLIKEASNLKWVTIVSGVVFLYANYFACGCTPFAQTGGRFFSFAMFSVAPLAALNVAGSTAVIAGLVHVGSFLLLAILEGSGVQCYTVSPGNAVHVVAQVFCQLVIPTALMSFALINISLERRREQVQYDISESFAKLCVKHALAQDVAALVASADEFDRRSNVTIPTMCDDAMCVLIDLLQKQAASQRPPTNATDSPPSPETVAAQRRKSSAAAPEAVDAPVGRKQSDARPLPFPAAERCPMVQLAIALPHLREYSLHPNANVELSKIFLTEFVDNCCVAVRRYGGVVFSGGFEFVYGKFDHISHATAAAVCLQELMRRVHQHHPDVAILDTKVLKPLCVVLQSNVLLGSIDSQWMDVATLGYSEATYCAQRVVEMLRDNELDKVGVFVPVSMGPMLSEVFVLKETPHKDLLKVSGCKASDGDGLPSVPPTGDGLTLHAGSYALPDLHRAATPVSRAESFATVGKHPSTTSSEERPRSRSQVLPPEALSAWEKYDTDGSGTLDIDECRAIFKDLGYRMSEEDIQEFFNEVDKDGSGTISKSEFAAAFSSPNLGGAAVMDSIAKAGTLIAKSSGGDAIATVLEKWQKYDKDNSGALDYSELALLLADLGLKHSPTEIEWLMKKLDRDGSGVVDFEEFSRLFANDNVTRQIAAKARSQTVTRVVNNKNSGLVYSNADQLLRDERVALAAMAEKYLTPLLFVYIAYNCGAITYNLALGTESIPSQTNMIIDLCLDTFLMGWVFVKYMYLPREDKGQIAFHRMDVLKHSVKTVDFYFDMLAVIPLDFVFIGLQEPKNGEVLAYYRCNKLLLYWYLDDCYKSITKSFNPAIVRAANAMVYFLSFAHLFACFLIGLVRDIGEDGPGVADLIGIEGFLSQRGLTYPIGLYWAIITLVGQNRGSTVPLLDKELALTTVAMLVGLPMYAVVLGTIAQSVQVDDSYSKFLDKIDDLRSYFQYTRLPEIIENECVAYYRHLYFTTGSLDITENPLEDLPAELSIQVVIQIGQEMLRKVPIFQDASKNAEFVHELTTKLVPEVIPPLTTVMKKGERGTNMYFITFGDFNIMSDTGVAVFTLKKGNFFGEIALLHNVKRTATITSFAKFSNVLSLDKKDFDEVTATFPDCLSQVYKAAEDRIKQILEREAEEAKQSKLKRKEERMLKRKESGIVGGSSSSDDEETLGNRRNSGALTQDLSKKSRKSLMSSKFGSSNSLATNTSGKGHLPPKPAE